LRLDLDHFILTYFALLKKGEIDSLITWFFLHSLELDISFFFF
jgi:hypothetical protein